MSEFVIFQVDCANHLVWMSEATIRCDMLVLLDDRAIVPISTRLNQCAVPHTVLRLRQKVKMKQIILTSCFMLHNEEYKTIRFPLIPMPTDFWLDDGIAAPRLALHMDYSKAVDLLEQSHVTKLLAEPLLLPLVPSEEVHEEIRQEGNFIAANDTRTNEENEPAPYISLSTNHSVLFHDTMINRDQDPEPPTLNQSESGHTLSPLELYLQQETAKNDQLIGFLTFILIVFLCILGFVGYRILPARQTPTIQKLEKEWKAKQKARRKQRPSYEKPFILKPVGTLTTHPNSTSSPPTKALPKGLVCVSPPRPLKSPPRNHSTPIRENASSDTKRSFADELKAKTHEAGAREVTTKAPVSWEELM